MPAVGIAQLTGPTLLYILHDHSLRMEGQSDHRPPTKGPTRAEGRPAEGPTTTGNTLPELNSLTEMLCVMLEDRERRERDSRREGTPRTRGGRGAHTTAQSGDAPTNGASAGEVPRTIIDSCTCQRTAERRQINKGHQTEGRRRHRVVPHNFRTDHGCQVFRDRWSFHLAPNLTGKAQQAYAALPPEDVEGGYSPTVRHPRGDIPSEIP